MDKGGQNAHPKSEVFIIFFEILNCSSYLLSEDDAFIAEVEDKYGRRGAKQAQELLAEVTGLFAGGELADEDMREMVDAIQEAYLIAKKNNKKYTPKKYRKDEQSSK